MMVMRANHIILIFLAAFFILLPAFSYSAITCSATNPPCVTQADVNADESQCLLIIGDSIYRGGSMGNGWHYSEHLCPADVTNLMSAAPPSHQASTFLGDYLCAKFCPTCTSSWEAGEWTACQPNGKQTRTVTDANNCATPTGTKPATEESCTYTPAPTCESVWNVGAWTACQPNGKQTRLVTDINNCPTPTGTKPDTERSCIYASNSTPIVPISPAAKKLCTPVCLESCGQDNGCGGQCPYYDYNTPGMCENSLCIADCSGPQCGQSDGCDGVCGAIDKTTCGLCGNPPCCGAEICGDNKDNSCDGRVDEGCSKAEQFFWNEYASLSDVPQIVSENLKAGTKILLKPYLLTRVAGMIAFFFAGLAVLIGVFRFELIKRYSRKEVIKYHTVIGFFVLFFFIVHIAALLFDKGGWAKTVHVVNFFVPYFSTKAMEGVAYGVIGMYLLLLVIINGVVFVGFSRKFGYPLWLLMHRASFVFYALVLVHSMRIGTDFKNPYVYIFFLQMLILSVAVVVYKKIKLLKIRSMLDNFTLEFSVIGKHLSIDEINRRRDLAGKTVLTSGNIVRVPVQHGEKESWYRIYDSNSSIFALVPEGTKPDYYAKIIGTVKVAENLVYIEVKKIEVK